MRDLMILVADNAMKMGIERLLARRKALGIREIECNIKVARLCDPECRTNGVKFLAAFANDYQHGLLIFDWEGSGADTMLRNRKQLYTDYKVLERDIKAQLDQTAWQDRANVVIIHPELEAWFWSDSPEIGNLLNWSTADCRDWLQNKHPDTWAKGQIKPNRPKEALEKVREEKRIPKSASLFQKAAETVSIKRCKDESFGRFKQILKSWFGSEL